MCNESHSQKTKKNQLILLSFGEEQQPNQVFTNFKKTRNWFFLNKCCNFVVNL